MKKELMYKGHNYTVECIEPIDQEHRNYVFYKGDIGTITRDDGWCIAICVIGDAIAMDNSKEPGGVYDYKDLTEKYTDDSLIAAYDAEEIDFSCNSLFQYDFFEPGGGIVWDTNNWGENMLWDDDITEWYEDSECFALINVLLEYLEQKR